MFGFFKNKNENVIYAPVEGTCIDITEVDDIGFSSKMMGDVYKRQELNRILPQVDYITLCSASAVRAYMSMLDEVGRQSDPRIICIGPVTERAAKAAGLTVHQLSLIHI